MPRQQASLIIPLLLFLVVVLIYLPGIGSAFYYDDYSNLSGLTGVVDWASFWNFVYSGGAGPLGRPLSLFSFAMQHSAWPNGSESFFAFNIALHALNAILVYLVSRKLYCTVCGSTSWSNEFGLIAASFWAVSPILASSSLILIQRMTTLTAFFMLVTVLVYLKAFDHFASNPLKRLLFQAFALGIGTLLAMYSKENGALLPALVFSIEVALLKNSVNAEPFRRVRVTVLALSVAAFVYYISPLARPWFDVSEFRGFSSWDRLQGQFFILWKYVYLTIFPRVAYFGPFQDQNVLVDDPVVVLSSALGWVALLLGSFWLRRRSPWVFFGVLWFLMGHLLESTTLLLEPYFEHRNYIPLVGVSMIFAHLMVLLIRKYAGIGRLAAYGFIAIHAGILVLITSLWGKPAEAAEFWVETNPGSVRAVVHQVNLSLGSSKEEVAGNNQAVLQLNRISGALKLLDKTQAWCENCLSINLQALMYSCIVESESAQRERVNKIISLLDRARARIDVAGVDATAGLSQLISSGRCAGVDYSNIDHILAEMLELRASSTSPQLISKLYYQRATLAYAGGRFEEVAAFIGEADKMWPEAGPVIDYQIEFYKQQGSPEKAMEIIERKLERSSKGEIHLSEEYIQSLKRQFNEISHENLHSPASKK